MLAIIPIDPAELQSADAVACSRFEVMGTVTSPTPPYITLPGRVRLFVAAGRATGQPDPGLPANEIVDLFPGDLAVDSAPYEALVFDGTFADFQAFLNRCVDKGVLTEEAAAATATALLTNVQAFRVGVEQLAALRIASGELELKPVLRKTTQTRVSLRD